MVLANACRDGFGPRRFGGDFMIAALIVLWLGMNVAFVLALFVRSNQPAIVAHHQRRDEVRYLEHVWSMS